MNETTRHSTPRSSTLEAWSFLASRWPLILLAGLVAGAFALSFTLVQDKQYQATAEMLVGGPSIAEAAFFERGFPSSGIGRDPAANLRLGSVDAIAADASDALDGAVSAGEISDAVMVEAVDSSNVVTVTATFSDPELTAAVANAFAGAYVEFLRQGDRERLSRARELVIEDLKALSPEARAGAEGKTLRRQITKLTGLRALQTGNAEVVEEATAPGAAISPKPKRNALLGGFLGLLVGAALALLLDRVDRRVKRPAALAEALGLPLLAEVPRSEAFGSAAESTSPPELAPPEAESFRLLRTRLRYFNVDQDLRTIAVTSPAGGEGKSTVARNLALIASQAGTRTLLIEADFHAPTLAEVARLSPSPGLSELLSGQSDLEGATQSPAVSGGRPERVFDVIAAGALPPNPAELLESDRARSLLDQVRESYELVVIDTPPVTLVADAIPLLTQLDGVVVVGRVGQTTIDQASELRTQLDELGITALGAVANDVPGPAPYYGS